MRILHVSDTHLGATLNARGPAGWCRASDHHEALRRALQPAFREDVDLVLHSGDVFDRSQPPRRWVVAAGELFAEVARRVPVVGIAGNHDRRGIRRWLPSARLTFVDQPTIVDHGIRIGLVPFCRDPERFSGQVASLGEVDLLAIHQGPAGCRVGEFQFRLGHPRDTVGAAHLHGLPWVACGHIHPRQVVQLGASTVVCGGSTERTSFAEAGQTKGAVIWTFERQVRWRFVDHRTRPMNTGTGALVRCLPSEVDAARARDQIAVVRRSQSSASRPTEQSTRGLDLAALWDVAQGPDDVRSPQS